MATEGTEPDCKRALEWVASLDATYVLVDKAYDSDDIIPKLGKIIKHLQPPKKPVKFYNLRGNQWNSMTSKAGKPNPPEITPKINPQTTGQFQQTPIKEGLAIKPAYRSARHSTYYSIYHRTNPFHPKSYRS
jgi:hypothetical protein